MDERESLKFLVWRDLSADEKAKALARPKSSQNPELTATVRGIIRSVRERGDQALKDLTAKFDGTVLETLQVPVAAMDEALERLPPDLRQAASLAIANIRKFHEAQKSKTVDLETMPGVRCERRSLPIEKVGLYIPAGTAPLPSTLMMLAVPALVAGCEEVILMSPPLKSTGEVDQVILALAALVGVKKVFRGGGAQAVAAMAYGTVSIPKVDKIFGPGNAYVTEAKTQVAFDPEGAMIDIPAGPSEVLVIADASCEPAFVAADLLSQAEHDTDSQVILIATSPQVLKDVAREVGLQLQKLSRKEVAAKALQSSRMILAESLDEALLISNLYAPEHLILQTQNARDWALKVKNAGSVFIGPWTPESVGDYASGTNHVLPTYGFARAMSGVNLDSFMKSISFQELTVQGLKTLGPSVEILATAEGLDAHRNAVTLRLKKINEG